MQSTEEARQILSRVFGFDCFREGQEQAISALLEGRSVLAIFPTGGGKSLCYQLPALLLDGLTVVVSPLIALMKDQVDFLRSRGVAAARLDSSLESAEIREVYDGIRSGRLKLLYVAPERLANERFVATLAGRNVDLLAIDEAHCISEWGHNFRPEYLRLGGVARDLRVGRVLALTATATPAVARNVAAAFEIADRDIVQTGFHRPNLELRTLPCRAEDRPGLLLGRLRDRPPGPAIVYVTLQKTAEEVASFLTNNGVEAVAYHAGLDDEVRHAVQDRFMASDRLVVVATIAFGMGIDKANIRAVYHYNLPKGPENYAQEIGRAGRDGGPAVCELLASRADVVVLENFAHGDTPTPEAIAGVVRHVLGGEEAEIAVSVYDVSGRFDVRPLVVQTLLTYLELEGALQAIGPRYDEAKVRLIRPAEEIIGRFEGERAEFIRDLLGQGRMAKLWRTIELDEAAQKLGQPRDRILKALNYLEEKEDLALQLAGLKLGYRRLMGADQAPRLAETLAQRFLDREAREVDRIGRMLEFATRPGCLTGSLLHYFGEDLPGACGHCGPCLGEPTPDLPAEEPPAIDRETIRAVDRLRAEGKAALATPRQLARFLCGLGSPATTRARLGKHPLFGALAAVPFRRVMEQFGEGAGPTEL
jgi:ATP-dependent DNA helicase RecQ